MTHCVEFSDILSTDHFWRAKLEEAQRRYSENPTPELRAELYEIQRLFADLVCETNYNRRWDDLE